MSKLSPRMIYITFCPDAPLKWMENPHFTLCKKTHLKHVKRMKQLGLSPLVTFTKLPTFRMSMKPADRTKGFGRLEALAA